MQQAWALYAQGRRLEAETLCRALLARDAGHTGAITLLGIVLAQARRSAEAAPLFERLTASRPDDPEAHNNYGNVLRDLGRYGKALGSYERAIALRAEYPDAHYNRGVTLHDLRRYAEALESYDRTVALKPQYASAWNNRGATLRALGRLEEALASYDRAISVQPNHAEAHNNRGVVLQELARLEESLASYERAVALRPEYAEAQNNRGAVLLKLERIDEALASLEHALAARPDYAEAHNHRGLVLQKLDRHEEALASYGRALAARPEYTEAHNNRATTLRLLRRYEESLACLRRALEIDPRCADAYYNQALVFIELRSFEEALASIERALALRRDVAGYVAQGGVLHDLKRSEEAVGSYQRALTLDPEACFLLGTVRHVQMQICDWNGLERDVVRIVEGIERDRPVARPFNVLSLVDSLRLQRQASEIMVRTELSPRRRLAPMPTHPPHDRIRVGYISADLRNHAVAILTSELFELHDRSRFELTALCLGANVRDEFRARIEPAFDRFLWVGAQSDEEIALLARKLEIDIAVDLGGYTGDARPRILALRAAPIQVSYLGYLGTMGGDFMDYLIADPVIVPPESRGHYSEKIAYLPSYQVNDSKRIVGEREFTRADLGLPDTGVVYCSFNASWKITPETFSSWMRILEAVPDSVLFLLAMHPAVVRNLRREAEARGISPGRLVFGGRLANAEYLARYRAADLFLDTFPYNAGTTASDALWAGLPVLTRVGESFAARVAASIVTAAGLPELVARDPAEYERLAIELATHPDRLHALRHKLAASRSSCPLFDTPAFTRNLERLYRQMYERHRGGLPAEHLGLG
jgi:predicted O-linked N-acetylglucosamine transferase (SPINDLY family)